MYLVRKPLFFLILIFSLFTKSILSSQVKSIGLPEVRNYKKSDYKGGTQNWDMTQDANGNLYFANNSGLLQFDGTSWNKYNLPNQSAVRCAKADKSGRIYVGGYNEFGYFKADEKGKLIYYSVSKLVNENNIGLIDFTWKIHLIDDEVIFQTFARAYIYKNNKLRLLDAPERFQFSFIVNERLYFQDISDGILEYRQGFLVPLEGSSLINNTEIWGMFSIPGNGLLVATLDKGLFTYQNGKMIEWKTEANRFLKSNSCLGGVIIQDKFLVLNSVLNGIIICTFDGKIIQHINRKKGIQNNTVLSSFVDSKDNLWLGLDNGIAFINENSPFSYFGFSYDLSTVYASVVYKNNLYVATNQGLFFHSWNKPFREDTFTLVPGTTGQAWNIQVINNVLLCGHNRGALVIVDGKVAQILDNSGYFGFKEIPNNPNYIIGAKYSGFSVFEKSQNSWKFRNNLEGFDKSASTFELDYRNLWLKKDNLVYQMNFSEDFRKFKSIRSYNNLSPKVKGIESIQRIQNKIYFQTDNQFFTFSPQDDSFSEDLKMSNLFKNTPKIRSLTEDALGNLWYVFGESIGVMIKESNGRFTNTISQFSNLTGNIVSSFPSINAVSDEDVFIGLTDGLAHYNPSTTNDFVTKPKAFVRSFSYANETVFIGNSQGKLSEITIPYSANNVKFTFSSPTYENLENVEYSYQLKGFDKIWSDWSTMSVKEYTNLREGNYQMKVKVRNSYGIQSEAGTVGFTISPPFYRHFLAYLFYVIFIIAAILYTRQSIKIKIRKNKYYETIEQRRLYLEKEAKIRQEQYELEKEIEKLKNDKLQIRILAKDKELVNNSLQVVKKNKILNGIIHKLKDIETDKFDDSTKFQFTKLNKSIVKEVNADKSWKDLEKHIKNVHFDFLKRLKERFPTISPRELDLSTYLLMNMSTKEIAEIMNISNGGVELARYRLRKKLGLNKKENLIGFLMSI